MALKTDTSDQLMTQLGELLKAQRRHRLKIAQVILSLIKIKPGGVNTKNCNEVFRELERAYHLPRITLARYVEIAQGLKLPELFDYLGKVGDLAWSLAKSDQEKIMYHGVPVWDPVTNGSTPKRLDDLDVEEAERLIDARNHRLRSVAQQREIKFNAKLVSKYDRRVVKLWTVNNRYCAVSVNRVSFADLCYIVRTLKKADIMASGNVNVELRQAVDAVIQQYKKISLPQGKSQA